MCTDGGPTADAGSGALRCPRHVSCTPATGALARPGHQRPSLANVPAALAGAHLVPALAARLRDELRRAARMVWRRLRGYYENALHLTVSPLAFGKPMELSFFAPPKGCEALKMCGGRRVSC